MRGVPSQTPLASDSEPMDCPMEGQAIPERNPVGVILGAKLCRCGVLRPRPTRSPPRAHPHPHPHTHTLHPNRPSHPSAGEDWFLTAMLCPCCGPSRPAVCLPVSVCRSVRPSVRPSVCRPIVPFVQEQCDSLQSDLKQKQQRIEALEQRSAELEREYRRLQSETEARGAEGSPKASDLQEVCGGQAYRTPTGNKPHPQTVCCPSVFMRMGTDLEGGAIFPFKCV